MSGFLAIGVLSVLISAPLVFARSPQATSLSTPANKRAFEVVSIRPTAPGTYPDGYPMNTTTQPGGRFRGRNTTLAGLVAQAFRSPERNIQASQIFGGPNWINTTRFEIIATLGTDIGNEEFVALLPILIRSMLEDRFKLQAHIETRAFPVFALVKARADGRLGRQLRPSPVDCAAILREQRAKAAASPKPPVTADRPPCDRVVLATGKILGIGITMNALAGSLRTASGRAVLDRTDLPGDFDLELHWSPDSLSDRSLGSPQPGLSDAPSLFTALQEQLGLKLDSRQEPTDVVVIDHVELPTPN